MSCTVDCGLWTVDVISSSTGINGILHIGQFVLPRLYSASDTRTDGCIPQVQYFVVREDSSSFLAHPFNTIQPIINNINTSIDAIIFLFIYFPLRKPYHLVGGLWITFESHTTYEVVGMASQFISVPTASSSSALAISRSRIIL